MRFAADGTWRSGDYWLIPARVAGGADGGIHWDVGIDRPAALGRASLSFGVCRARIAYDRVQFAGWP